MLNKKEIKDIQSLSHKKARDESGLFIAEGPKIVTEFMSIIPGYMQKILALDAWIKQHPELKDFVFEVINETELERISQLQTPNQVLALVKKVPAREPDASKEFCLYLDTIQDPGNLGTIVRTADWFGISSIVCSVACADMYNPKVVQSTMASIARVNVYYDNENNWLQKQKTTVYAAVLGGQALSAEKIKCGVLVIGNESKGISQEVLKYATKKISIPRIGQAESLNAAVATGIILSHLL